MNWYVIHCEERSNPIQLVYYLFAYRYGHRIQFCANDCGYSSDR